jgi:hypothetical protein
MSQRRDESSSIIILLLLLLPLHFPKQYHSYRTTGYGHHQLLMSSSSILSPSECEKDEQGFGVSSVAVAPRCAVVDDDDGLFLAAAHV